MPSVDELIRMLVAGQLGPWAGQGFVPGGITILRPDTMQWETIVGDPGDAALMHSELGDPVEAGSSLEPASPRDMELSGYVETGGIPQGLPITTGVTGGVQGAAPHVLASVIPASAYVIADFTRTALGAIRMSEGLSNGVSGPLSPIRIGNDQAVDKDGVPWLPVVRIGGIDSRGEGGIGPD